MGHAINAQKCEHITFTRKRRPSYHVIYIHQVPMSKKNTVKYLGVMVELVWPITEYASKVWDSLTMTVERKLEGVQKRAARYVCNIRATRTTGLIKRLQSELLGDEKCQHRLNVFRSCRHGGDIIEHCLSRHPQQNTTQRHHLQYPIPHCWCHRHQRSFFVTTGQQRNKLPLDIAYLIYQIKSS